MAAMDLVQKFTEERDSKNDCSTDLLDVVFTNNRSGCGSLHQEPLKHQILR